MRVKERGRDFLSTDLLCGRILLHLSLTLINLEMKTEGKVRVEVGTREGRGGRGGGKRRQAKGKDWYLIKSEQQNE